MTCKTLYSFIVLFLLSLTGFAQKAPGYQGHRFTINYDFIGHPTLGGAILENVFSHENGRNVSIPPFIFSQSLSADYTYNRRSSIGGSFQFFSFSGSTIYPYMYGNGYSNSYNGTGSLISIYIRHFGRRSADIAPLGRYIKPELNFLSYSGTVHNDAYIDNNGYIQPATSTSFKSSVHTGFSLSYGRTSILFNHIIINRGIRYSLNNLGHQLATYFQGNNSATASDPAITTVLNNQFFNLFVGIGILP
ncbi:MAG TPA: hypothetical protein VGO45_07970 [Bacteroidia bacterium]|jgi:hypothetical protein|nr:hypothetical protein [Bacteroidia bacterium]